MEVGHCLSSSAPSAPSEVASKLPASATCFGTAPHSEGSSCAAPAAGCGSSSSSSSPLSDASLSLKLSLSVYELLPLPPLLL